MITYNQPQGKTPLSHDAVQNAAEFLFGINRCVLDGGCTQSLPSPVLSGMRLMVWSNLWTETGSKRGISSTSAWFRSVPLPPSCPNRLTHLHETLPSVETWHGRAIGRRWDRLHVKPIVENVCVVRV